MEYVIQKTGLDSDKGEVKIVEEISNLINVDGIVLLVESMNEISHDESERSCNGITATEYDNDNNVYRKSITLILTMKKLQLLKNFFTSLQSSIQTETAARKPEE